MLLMKEAGMTRRDIRGSTTERVRYEERTDLVARIKRCIPFLENPPLRVVRTVEEEPGMGEEEVLRHLIYHDEHERMKEEEAEDSQQEARRKMGNIGSNQQNVSYTR